MSYMSIEDPHRPPIIAPNAFQAGKKTMEQEVAELKLLLEAAVNLYVLGQATKNIFEKQPVKEASEAEAMRLIGRIEKILLEQ